MAASTISRATWVNDTGTAANPNADGTVINNTRLQDDVYAKIDQMFAGAGAYATLTFGGLIAAEGFGTHTFSAGGTGAQAISLRNTSAGTGNETAFNIGNNTSATCGQIKVFSSTFTTSGIEVADGMLVRATQAGGLNIVSSNASGPIRFCANGTTERMRLDTGQLFIGDTANADVTTGLTITQGDHSAMIALKSTDVAHGITTHAETDTAVQIRKALVAAGGVLLRGLTSDTTAIHVQGYYTTDVTTKSTAAGAAALINCAKKSGTTVAAMGADANILAVQNNGTTRFILDGDGESHQDIGTQWTNFHGHDDIELLNTLSAHLTRKDDPLRVHFVQWLESNREPLEKMRLVTFNEDGHHFLNLSRLNMLKVGAILQLAQRIQAIEQRMGEAA